MIDLTDLEITRLCANAMHVNIEHVQRNRAYFIYHPLDAPIPLFHEYAPLTNDEQMVGLVKRFELCVWMSMAGWCCGVDEGDERCQSAPSLNRAVCRFVALMQKERGAK